MFRKLFSFLFVFVFLSAVVAQAPDVGVKKDIEELNAGNVTFTLALYQATVPKEGNFLLAPGSIIPALGMTYLGAAGDTREEMAKVFLAVLENSIFQIKFLYDLIE